MSETSDRALRLETEEIGSAVVVRVRGSLSFNEAESMRVQLEELTARQVPMIVLDLCEMDFICSGGLGEIISGHLKCRRYCGELRLVNPQPEVRRLLETTRLTKLFPLYASVEQALAT